jgi:hypothetical protein
MRVDHGESAKVDETSVNLTGDDLKQQRNSFKFSDMQSKIACMITSVFLYVTPNM